MCHGDDRQWLDALPIVMLGLRTAYKTDIKGSPAELLFGTPLRVPGEFLENADTTNDTETFIMALRNKIRQLRPQPSVHHGKRKAFTHPDIKKATHVFIREGKPKRSLQLPYTGPHEVIKRQNDRTYVININGQNVVTSTERIKPAYLPEEDNQDVQNENAEDASTSPTSLINKSVKFAPTS